jgi:hypothetical protein
VTTLGTRAYLKSSDEHIVRVTETIIVWIWHGIEWANVGRILVQHEKVSSILFLDCFSQSKFLENTMKNKQEDSW